MSTERPFIIATAGHVDHGKSALISALTGIDPDRLPEEKARGITIDLGFGHLKLSSPSPNPTVFNIGIVDVPGHEDFVKNMVGGVGSIDLALLVVAADDWWMPQTEEHLQILAYLGVTHAVVALSKIDLVQDEKAAIASVRERLLGTPFADAPIVPTSTVTRRGLEDLKAAFVQVLEATPEPRDFGKPRLPVDRVFTMHGIGTIVTGTLTGGMLRRGQSVVIEPSGKITRIRNIQCYGETVEASGPGMRTALNLPDLTSPEAIGRGDVVTLQEFGSPSKTLDALLEISPRATRLLRNGARVWVHYGSGSVAARVLLLEEKHLAVGQKAVAQLRLEAPAFVFAGDRCILRDWAEQHTLAGAIVLDPDASGKSVRSPMHLNFLRERAEASGSVPALITSLLARDGHARHSQLLTKSRFSKNEISDAVSSLASEGKIHVVGDAVIDAASWRGLRKRLADAIDTGHREHPERNGSPVAELRAALANEAGADEIVSALLKDLCAGEFVQSSGLIRRAAHRPTLPARLQAAGAQIRTALVANAFDPPSRARLAPDPLSQQALRFLIDTGEAIEVSPDVVMSSESVTRAIELIRLYITSHGPATISELRQALGSSRRVVVPLIERLDRQSVTVRQGETRVLHRGS